MAADLGILFTDAISHRSDVLNLFRKTDKDVEQDVNILRKWLQSQPHLPEVPCDAIIERILVLCKFSIENTKRKLDMRYTIRGLVPELYENRNPKSACVIASARDVYLTPLPKYTKELCRVIVYKERSPDVELVAENVFAHFLGVFEVRMHEDYAAGDIYVCDLSTSTFKSLSHYTPALVKKFFGIMENVYANRIKGIHYINTPSYASSLITLIKSTLKPKIAARIYVHKEMDNLYEVVPREVLPKDCGGNGMTLLEINELWLKKMEQYYDQFDRQEKMKVDESLRPEKLVNDDFFGFYGNFKKINLD